MAKFKKDDLLELEDGEAPEGFEIVSDGDWSVDCKYQHRDIIFSHGGKFYRLVSTRSGSPFTDYEYDSQWWDDEVECAEVESAEKITTYWRVVKHG
jgi:hypothetical protein